METIDSVFNNSDAVVAGLSFGVILIIAIIVFIIHIVVSLVPVFMARNRGRSGILWFVISLCIGWFWAVIILLIVGDTAEKKIRDMEMYYGNN